MARTKFSELRDQVDAKPGAAERMAALRADTLEEIRLYELRQRMSRSLLKSPRVVVPVFMRRGLRWGQSRMVV